MDPVPFLENGLRFFADVSGGQKTGFFLDQRDNRARLRALARGRRVLNLFSYSGAFSVAALAGGAVRAVDVDSSAPALVSRARASLARTRLSADGADLVQADVFEDVRRRVAEGQRWDVVVCDPPAFAKKKADVERAARGYKDVNRLAMTLVSPGRMAADLLVLGAGRSGALPEDRLRRVRGGRRRLRADRAAGRRRRSSGLARLSRGGIPQGTLDAARSVESGTYTRHRHAAENA